MLARLLVILFALLVIGAGGGDGVLRARRVVGALATRSGSWPTRWRPSTPTTRPAGRHGAAGLDRGRIGAELQQRGLVRSALVFRLAAEQAGVGASLVAGDYELSRSMSTNEIIQVLAHGQVKRGLVATIPEGWRAEQIADRLESTGFASRDEFLRAVAAPALRARFRSRSASRRRRASRAICSPTPTRCARGSPARAPPSLMVQMFDQRVGDAAAGASAERAVAAQVITLASIVEREAKQPSERATIASVYLNRLAAACRCRPIRPSSTRLPRGTARGRGGLQLLEND